MGRYDYKTEQLVEYALNSIKKGQKLTKWAGYEKCQVFLSDYSCELVIIKVNENFKGDWYYKNEKKLKEQYPETSLDLETIYVANLYQGVWVKDSPTKTLFANSLGQLLRGENIIENIADYPIDWIVVNEEV